MSIFLGILLTLVVLLIVVMIHEFGHFITARLTGMKVEEFGVGIPPRVRKIYTDKKGTEYTLNWLPIGGFVRILGEDPRNPDAKQPGSFITKPWLSRVIVLVAGVTMNFFLAFVIFTGLFLYGIAPMAIIPIDGNDSLLLPSAHEAKERGYELINTGITVTSLTGSIARMAGVGSGEIVISINGKTPIIVTDILDITALNQEFEMILQSSEDPKKQHTIRMQPKNGKVGMIVSPNNLRIHENTLIKYSGFEALKMGGQETIATTGLTYDFLVRMVVGLYNPKNDREHNEAKSMLAGPIGLGSTFVSIVENSVPLSIILVMIALLSINLGVVNILPLPALDGGRIITTTLYSLFSYIPHGKRYFPKVEGMIHTAGFLLLLAFMIYVSGLDISRFF